MARGVFFSFHYDNDIWRVNQVKNHYVTKGGYSISGYFDRSVRESVKKQSETNIRRSINQALEGTTVTVILVGAQTVMRPWVRYEIQQSIKRGNGFVSIQIHNLANQNGLTDYVGRDPLQDHYALYNGRRTSLATIFWLYDWVVQDGFNNFSEWVENAAGIAGK